MKNIILFLLIIALSSAAINAQVITYIPTLNNQNAGGGLYFVNNDFGYIYGSNFVSKTTNGGFNWNVYPTGISGASSIHFYNESVAYLSKSDRSFYKSTNGGSNWVNVTPSPSRDIYNFKILSENEVVIFDGDSLTIRTTNGGLNWSYHRITGMTTGERLHNSGMVNDGNDLYIIQRYDYSPSSSWSKIFKSSDYGVSFISSNVYGSYLWDRLYVKNGHIWAMGKIYEYVSLNWITSSVITHFDFFNSTATNYKFDNASICRDMYMTIQGQGYAYISSGNVMKTTNFGNNWAYEMSVPGTYAIEAVRNNLYLMASSVSSSSIKLTIYLGIVGIKKLGEEIPKRFELKQNYPNPFNPITKINFSIPQKMFINLKVYDTQGKEISTLVKETLNEGFYEYIFDGKDLSSGIYFYTLNTENFTETKKMVLIK